MVTKAILSYKQPMYSKPSFLSDSMTYPLPVLFMFLLSVQLNSGGKECYFPFAMNACKEQ